MTERANTLLTSPKGQGIGKRPVSEQPRNTRGHVLGWAESSEPQSCMPCGRGEQGGEISCNGVVQLEAQGVYSFRSRGRRGDTQTPAMEA